MKTFGYKTPALALAIAVLIMAGQAIAAEHSNATSTHKATSHLMASRTTTTHPVTRKTSAPVSRSAAVRRSTAAHHAASRGNARVHNYSTPVKATPPGTASQRKGSTGRNHSTRRPRVSSGQQRLARLHLEPARVQEIQRALASQGYLQGEPTGEWDAGTRDAMLHYQASHGFPTTGLPEAKSLMKLGLGPHPLSPNLDHGQVATANAGVTATVQNVFAVSPDLPPSSPATPASLGTVVPETK